MKKAKQKFDDLAQKIESGEKVNFGQMEQAFAETFLERFMENLKSRKLRLGETKSHEEDEEEEITDAQRAHYELDTVRAVSATLGVRPSITDLRTYVSTALSLRDWGLLDKATNLSREGTLEQGIIEKIALEDIVCHNDYEYHELKEHFEQLNFTPELVIPVYERAISAIDIKSLGNLIEETGIPIPGEIVQSSYESLVENDDIDHVLELNKLTKIKPKKTQKLVEGIKSLKAWKEIQYSPEFGRTGSIPSILDSLFEISLDESLAIPIQKTALDEGNTDTFLYSYEKTEFKLPSQEIKKGYEKLDQQRKGHDIEKIAKKTRVAPDERILRKIYSDMIGRKDAEDIISFSQETGTKPTFEQQTLEKELGEFSFRGIDDFIKYARIAKLADIPIKEVYLARAFSIQYRHPHSSEEIITNTETAKQAYLEYGFDFQNFVSSEMVGMLESGHTLAYDILRRYRTKDQKLNNKEKKFIRDGALRFLAKGETQTFDDIVSRASIEIRVKPRQSKEIVDNYLKSGGKNPSQIARRLNTALDPDQIQDEMLRRLTSRQYTGLTVYLSDNEKQRFESLALSRIKEQKILEQDSGISITEKRVRASYNQETASALLTSFDILGVPYSKNETEITTKKPLDAERVISTELPSNINPKILKDLDDLERKVVISIANHDLLDYGKNIVRDHAIGLSYVYEIVFDILKTDPKYNDMFQESKRNSAIGILNGLSVTNLEAFERDSLAEVSPEEFMNGFNKRRTGLYGPLASISQEFSGIAWSVRNSLYRKGVVELEHLLPRDEEGKLGYYVSGSFIRRRETKNDSRQIAIAKNYIKGDKNA